MVTTLAAASVLIVNALVVDGTGAPWRTAAVRVRGDRITEVGSLTAAPGESVFDAKGMALAPGFIDTHSHGDGGLFERLGALAAVSQGISTIVVGQDGGSPLPLADFFARLEKEPAAVNVALLASSGGRSSGVTVRKSHTPCRSGFPHDVRSVMLASLLSLIQRTASRPYAYSSIA